MLHQIGHPEALQRHFMGIEVTPGHQRVLVGTKPLDDGWVMSIIKIDGCTNETEAVWLGRCMQSDLIEYISIANDEVTPVEAVMVESGQIAPGTGWTVAVYVILASPEEATAMFDFMTAYATKPSTWKH